MSTAFAASRRASSATAKRPAMPDAAAGAGAGAGVGTKAAGAAPAQPKKRVALGNISNVPAAGGRAAAVAGHGKEVPPPPPGTAVRTVRPSNRRGDRSFVRLRAGIGGDFVSLIGLLRGPQQDSSSLARLATVPRDLLILLRIGVAFSPLSRACISSFLACSFSSFTIEYCIVACS